MFNVRLMSHYFSSTLLVLTSLGCSKGAFGPTRSEPAPTLSSRSETMPLALGSKEYFERRGLNVMAFSDFYPEGHQGGVSIIQNGIRTAANGDLRLEPAPGQWQPVPKLVERVVDEKAQAIVARLSYPDEAKHLKGFNPIVYPELKLDYSVRVQADGQNFRVVVDLEEPLPADWVGRVGFNLELFPGEYFGKGFLMDAVPGTFPRQVSGPVARDAQGRIVSDDLAHGSSLTVAPESKNVSLRIESLNEAKLQLIDGRVEHNNGWFIVRTLLPAKKTKNAIEWKVSPRALENWLGEPSVHLSQVGYHPKQEKIAVIELDKNDAARPNVQLQRFDEAGLPSTVLERQPSEWGDFLRYRYQKFDFSDVKKPGLYRVQYGKSQSNVFRIDPAVFDRHVWQPTLEYFLPVQMCHVRVNDRYRVWHDHCHQDDARMAPVDVNHFDGYVQGHETLTRFKPGQRVSGLNRGGWHDAGDYDLRVESQMRTVRILSQIYEAFALDYDATTIDQNSKVVEMHRPDGKADVLQQIEHGVLSVLAGYEKMGRLYRGIIAPGKRQYVLLGDASAQTDHLQYRSKAAKKGTRGRTSSIPDDRWVFTEKNTGRQLEAAAGLAAASRALRKYDSKLAERCLRAARGLVDADSGDLDGGAGAQRIDALVELSLATGEERFVDELLQRKAEVFEHIEKTGWSLGRLLPQISDRGFIEELSKRMRAFRTKLDKQAKATPFGVPYEPNIWGAGWGVQSFGVPQYFLYKAWPEIFDSTYLLNALNFVLGNHPGSNGASFVSGVGAESLTVAYGVNRADWSYIPGGVGSGTALIRPDFPELKTWPFFWQQSEYVVGGGGTHFLFLVLAAQQLFNDLPAPVAQ